MFWPIPFSLCIVLTVAIFIILRDCVRWRIPIWVITLLGAAVVILSPAINIRQSISACDPDVLGYLLGVFILAAGLDISGGFDWILTRFIPQGISGFAVLGLIVFIAGPLSALLMNDTLAVAVTPLIILITKEHIASREPLLLGLAYSLTIGSVWTPLGNPQNLLIMTMSQIHSPFAQFIHYLLVPTIVNLLICYGILGFAYRQTLRQRLTYKSFIGQNPHTKYLAISCMSLFLSLVVIAIVLSICQVVAHIPLVMLALGPAVLLLILSHQRVKICKSVDWGTLIFFISLFVLVHAVWISGYLQDIISHYQQAVLNPVTIGGSSLLLSQAVSNVPLVMLFGAMLHHVQASPALWFMLAASATFAGNVTILGAASNVIIIQLCERRGYQALHSFRFMLYGIPLAILNLGVCVCWWHFL